MLPSAYESGTTYVYWIVGVGLPLRHATGTRPGALPGGDWIPAICETWMRVPFDTPPGWEPSSKSVTEHCPQCSRIVADNHYSAITWDS